MGEHKRKRSEHGGRWTPPEPKAGEVIRLEGVTLDGLPFELVAVWCDDPECLEHGKP